MKINITPKTVGRYGGVLQGNLRFLPRAVQSSLEDAGFVSTFEELHLSLAYPPMYVLPGVVTMVSQYFEHYNTLPHSRLDRKSLRIEIAVKAPEFSEHFDLKDQGKYSDRFEIDRKYQGIPETELAKALIDKCLEAGKIISSKVRKEGSFDFAKFKTVLSSLKESISVDFLSTVHKEQATRENDEILNKALRAREERRRSHPIKDKRVKDVRIYYNEFPDKALYPYDFQYVEIFRNLLRRSNLLCPGYHHLYIQVSKSFEEGLRRSLPQADWHVYGVSVLDYDTYLRSTESDKEQIVIDLISRGLLDIATVDNLDVSIITEITGRIKSTRLQTELLFNRVENNNHALMITYLSGSTEDQCPIFLRLFDKKTNQTGKIQIGKADNSQIYFWLQKISLTKKTIKIKSSGSIEADVYLRDKPRTMEFTIDEIMRTPGAGPDLPDH